MGDAMDHIQMTGIVNAMKTGNLAIDMAIAMSIPIVLRILFGFLAKIDFQQIKESLAWIWRRPIPETEYYERTIIHRTEKDSKGGSFANVDTDSNNHILVKAIMMYLHHLQCLKLKTADLELTSIKAGAGSGGGSSNDYYYYDSASDDEEDNALYNTLSKLKIVKTPPVEEWHLIGPFPSLSSVKHEQPSHDECPTKTPSGGDGLFNVEFSIDKSENENAEEEEGQDGKKVTQRIQTRETKLNFRSLGEHSIDGFVEAAYAWYLNEIKKLGQDDSRFYYEIINDEDKDQHTYKRYRLSDEKTFDSLFFREKTTIVKLFGHFMNGTGRYGIKGYPQKLGLLLYGPPGTGKTSLIKAVAQYTKRHIVNVPLARIKTNAELNTIFFGNSFNVEGEYYSVKMGFKDVVYVMEDVDAASSIVKRRDGKKTAAVTRTEHVDLPAPRCMWRLLLESQEVECQELVAKLIEKSERLKAEAQSTDTLYSFAQRMTSLPGLTLAGHEGDVGSSSTVRKIASEALEMASKMMESSKALDEYLKFHAGMIKSLLEKGAQVGEEFENELLGLSSPSHLGGTHRSLPPLPEKGTLSRDVSYEKYDDGAKNFVEVGNMDSRTIMPGSAIPYSISPNNFITSHGAGFANGLKDLGQDGFGGGFNAYHQEMGGLGKDSGQNNKGGLGSGLKSAKFSFGGGGGFGGGGLGGFGNDWMRPVRDELNLSGLLNVLDGVVDTPGRILIMTTNHPEVLDPALIRPGRIDKKLILGYMEPNDVVQMLEHYFQTKLDAMSINRVTRAVLGDGAGRSALSLTPAQIEQITAEQDDVESMIDALEKKGQQPLHESLSNMDAPSRARSSVITYDGMS
jgi:mitochondrial chaperone BCS1